MPDDENVSIEIAEEVDAKLSQQNPDTNLSQENEPEKEEVKESTEKIDKRKDAEYNFAELRRQREEDRRRAEEAMQLNQRLLSLLEQQKHVKTQEERDQIEEELEKLAKDDLTTVDQVDKKIRTYDKHKTKREKELEGKIDQLQGMVEEQIFRSKYPDLDEVLSNENIELLKQEEPEIAAMLAEMPNIKQKATLAYKYIKKILPPKPEVTTEKKKAIENSQKPISVQAIAKKSAVANQHLFEEGKLTPELQKELWKEMQEAKKRL